MPTATPVALMAFNRPDLAERVFAEIRHAQPSRFFFIADGPRSEADTHKCSATQALAERVDWPCKVETNIAPTNIAFGWAALSTLLIASLCGWSVHTAPMPVPGLALRYPRL